MDTAIALVNLFNTAAPGVAQLIVLIRNKNGNISVVAMLDEADAQFSANMKQAEDWLASHPKT